MAMKPPDDPRYQDLPVQRPDDDLLNADWIKAFRRHRRKGEQKTPFEIEAEKRGFPFPKQEEG